MIGGQRQLRKDASHNEADEQQMDDHHELGASPVPHLVTLPIDHSQPTRYVSRKTGSASASTADRAGRPRGSWEALTGLWCGPPLEVRIGFSVQSPLPEAARILYRPTDPEVLDTGLVRRSEGWTAVPGIASSSTNRPPAMGPVDVDKDGRSWRIGTADDVAWIAGHTVDGLTVTAAIPPRFEAYATFYPPEGADITLHEHTIVDILMAHTTPQPWWLGYLDTGAHDIVFNAAPR